MVLKNDEHSGEDDDFLSTKNGVGSQTVDCQASSLFGTKISPNISAGHLEGRIEVGKSYDHLAPEDSEILKKSTSHKKSAEDPLYSKPSLIYEKRKDQKGLGQANNDCSGGESANHVKEAVCSDRDKNNNSASCGSDKIHNLGLGDDAVDFPTISGGRRMDCDIGGISLLLNTQSQLSEASTNNFTPSYSDKCPNEDDKVNKLNERAVSDETHAASDQDADDFEVEEEDVKVCDICGDAGRDDLLAVCSRCSDGAEHTYCMREMLDKVPEGEWLCEECKCNELEARKHDQSKKLGSNERSKLLERTSSLRSDLSLKLDIKDPCSERNKLRNDSLNIHASSKRSKQALESSVGSPMSSSPSRITVLSKDMPSKNLDKMKNKPSNHISIGTESSGDSPFRNSHHVMKGNLLKSNSFSSSNSKQNVKASEDLQNRKQGVDARQGSGKLVGKSMSFKGLGRSNANEPKVKMLSPKCAPVHDLKGLKYSRDRNLSERKNTVRSDHSFPGQLVPNSSKRPSRGADGMSSLSVSTNCDYNNSQTDGKLTNLWKHTSHMGHKSSEVTAGLGSACVNGTSSSSDGKLNHSCVKDDPTLNSSQAADRSHGADGLDSQTQNDPENSTVHFRQGLNGGVVGGSRRGLLSDASAPKIKEGLHEDNRLKAAIEAAMQKKQDIFKKNKIPEKPDGIPMLNELADHVGDADADQSKDFISEEAMHEGDTSFHNSNFSKQISINTAKQFNVYPNDSAKSPVGKAHLTVSAIPELDSVWQGGFEIHRTGKVPDMCGGFQAHISSFASGKVFETVRMFPQKIVLNEVPRPVHFKQVGAREDHIALYFFAKDMESYIRSYKILVDYLMRHDLALKGNINGVELLVFPSNHLPDKSQCWNTLYFMWGVFRGRRVQCSDGRLGSPGTTELSVSNMALLGKDIGSTEDPCLHRPAVEDLSVSGSSHIDVPVCGAPVIHGLSIQQHTSLLNGDYHKEESSAAQTCLNSPINPDSYEKLLPKNHDTGVCEAGLESGSAALNHHCQRLPDRIVEHQKVTGEIDAGNNVLSKVPLGHRQEGDTVVSSEDLQELDSGSNYFDELKSKDSSKQEQRCLDNAQKNEVQVKLENDINRKDDMDYWVRNDGLKLKSECKLKHEGYMDINVSADRSAAGLQSMLHSPVRHSHEEFIESISSAASMIKWVDRKDISEDSDGAYKKKRKKQSDNSYELNICRDPSFGGNLEAQICGVSPGFQREAASNEADFEYSPSTNPGSTQGCFFLGNSYPASGIYTRDPLPLKGGLLENEERLPDGSPNLELALGVKMKQSQDGGLPFLTGLVDRKDPDRRPEIESSDEEDEDASASLSLSLGFPFPDNKMARPEGPSETAEQPISRRHGINTSLLLFRGPLDK